MENKPAYRAEPGPLTPEQLAALFAAVRTVGEYGRVTLIIERGRLRLMEVSHTVSMARLETWDRMEGINK